MGICQGTTKNCWAKQSSKFRPDDKAVKEVIQAFGNPPKVPENFEITTSPYDPTKPKKTEVKNVIPVINPQTETFCAKLGIKNPCYSKEKAAEMYTNPEEIDLGGDGGDNDEVPKNPDGISLDSDDDDDAEAEVICATVHMRIQKTVMTEQFIRCFVV